jgi:3-hydroxymyristoyl/3-hydroxydecanoyl-(acyl carrier protein) dehydratase
MSLALVEDIVPARRFEPRPRPGQPGAFDVHVPRELTYFEGHFDGHAILAGIVQLEILIARQVSAIWPELTRIRRVTRLRFRVPIHPGDDIVLELERPKPARVDFAIRRGATACSSGTLHF